MKPLRTCDPLVGARAQVGQAMTEYIVLVVAHVPHVLLVEHNFFLAPLQRRKIPAFHHPSTSSADLQHLILRVLVRKYPLVINNFELVQL